MDIQPAGLTTLHSETNYIALFKSATGELYASYRSLPEGQDPEDFAADLANAYKQHANKLKHIFYRGVLFKTPLVSIAKISEAGRSSSSFPLPGVTPQSSSGPLPQITNSAASAPVMGRLFVQEHVYDPTLTAAMNDTTTLRNIDRDSFYATYDEIIVKTGGPTPRAAIFIHLEDDPTATKFFRIVSSIVSMTVGLAGIFAF